MGTKIKLIVPVTYGPTCTWALDIRDVTKLVKIP